MRAVTAAGQLRPDVVVLDVMLPDIDGLDVLRRLRADNPHVCVLFLTARDAVEDRIAGITAGGDDYVTKPFSLEEGWTSSLRAPAPVTRRRWDTTTATRTMPRPALSARPRNAGRPIDFRHRHLDGRGRRRRHSRDDHPGGRGRHRQARAQHSQSQRGPADARRISGPGERGPRRRRARHRTATIRHRGHRAPPGDDRGDRVRRGAGDHGGHRPHRGPLDASPAVPGRGDGPCRVRASARERRRPAARAGARCAAEHRGRTGERRPQPHARPDRRRTHRTAAQRGTAAQVHRRCQSRAAHTACHDPRSCRAGAARSRRRAPAGGPVAFTHRRGVHQDEPAGR
jgi:CheY-like chemotaxis protein